MPSLYVVAVQVAVEPSGLKSPHSSTARASPGAHSSAASSAAPSRAEKTARALPAAMAFIAEPSAAGGGGVAMPATIFRASLKTSIR